MPVLYQYQVLQIENQLIPIITKIFFIQFMEQKLLEVHFVKDESSDTTVNAVLSCYKVQHQR